MAAVVEALEGFRAAGDSEGAAEAATIAARLSWLAGDRAETDRLIAIALETVGDRPQSRAAARALSQQTGFLMLGGRFEEAIQVGAEALPRVEALGMEEQRARIHIVVGCARCCLGNTRGLDEIEAGIEIAEAGGYADMQRTGYMQPLLGAPLLRPARGGAAAWQRGLDLADRYRLGRSLRLAQADAANWAYVDGSWDEAMTIAEQLIAAAEAGERHYSDRASRAARVDPARPGRNRPRGSRLGESSRACASLGCAGPGSRVHDRRGGRARGRPYGRGEPARIRAGVDRACGGRRALRPVPDPHRHRLGLRRPRPRSRVAGSRARPVPIESPWGDAARAIVEGDLTRAGDIIDSIGNRAAAAHTRLRAAERTRGCGSPSRCGRTA